MSLADRLFRDHFESILVDTIDQSDTNPQSWSVAGRGKRKSQPQGEDLGWWRANGPDMVTSWMEWRKKSGWQVWTSPDGEPGIELDIVTDIPGTLVPDPFPLKMFIDRVFRVPETGQLCIVDLKTGARTPESDLQLGVYKYGLFRKFGIDIPFGGYWMARKGDMEIVDISRYTPALIETWFNRFRSATNNGTFLPHPTFMCRACPVRDYCVAFGGSRSELDPDHPNNQSMESK